MRSWQLTVFIALQIPLGAIAAEPTLAYAVPSALQPGATTLVTIHGENLHPGTLWTSFPHVAEGCGPATETSHRFLISLPSDAPAGGIGLLRFIGRDGSSDLLPIMIDDLNTATATGTNRSPATAKLLMAPIAIEGCCQPRQSDYYRLEVPAGCRLEIDVVAARLGSQLDALLRLLDDDGRELAYCDDGPQGPDPQLTHLFPEPATCLLELRDTRYEGGPAFRYRLRVSSSPLPPVHFLPLQPPLSTEPALPWLEEQEPNNRPDAATSLPFPAQVRGEFDQPGDRDWFQFTAAPGSRWRFAGRTRSVGSPCDLFLELRKADGTMLVTANVAGRDEGTITNRFDEGGQYQVMVEELNRMGGPGLRYELTCQPLPAGFELSVETDRLQAAPGQTATLKVNVLRRDYAGPIELFWMPEPIGLNAQPIPEKENTIELKTTVPEGLAPGQWLNLRLLGRGQVQDQLCVQRARTTSAIEKAFPLLLYPPTEFDGLITLSAQ